MSIVEFLTDQGANINSVNKEGSTPLLLAASEYRISIVDFLITKGAIETIQNKEFYSLRNNLHHEEERFTVL